MLYAHAHSAARMWRSRIYLVASLATLLFVLAGSHTTASADCTTGGPGCLPASGYTFDRIWNCGAINTALCYYDGTTSVGSANPQHWGWGSASYDGAGDVFVCIHGSTFFVGCGVDLARACFSANCDDQDAATFPLSVRNQSGVSHTISGHGMA